MDKKTISGMGSSIKQNWETPVQFFNELNKEFGFTLDPCAEVSTAKVNKFYSKEDNGLIQSWANEICFINPPYNNQKQFIEKAINEKINGCLSVCLIPARTDTKLFHDLLVPNCEIRLIKGRIKFKSDGELKNSPFFPSMLVIIGKDIKPKITTYNKT